MATSSTSDITSQALALPSEARSELASALLRSLEVDLPPGQNRTAQEWAEEIQRRSDELHAGTMETMPASESIAQGKAIIEKAKRK